MLLSLVLMSSVTGPQAPLLFIHAIPFVTGQPVTEGNVQRMAIGPPVYVSDYVTDDFSMSVCYPAVFILFKTLKYESFLIN